MSVFCPALPHNEHLRKIEEHFGKLEPKRAEVPSDLRFTFICFVNRSGSNYLSELLASGGNYNSAATEWLNWQAVIPIATKNNTLSFHDYFSLLIRSKAKTGRIIIKTAIQHIQILVRAGIMDQVMDRSSFVLIDRQDRLAQAISFALMQKTAAFTSQAKPVMSNADVPFDRGTVDRAIHSITASYASLSIFFGFNGIVPINVIYERLVFHPAEEAERVARECGMADFTARPSNVAISKQSDATNDRWRALYLDRQVIERIGSPTDTP